jgi:hypothetical protein
VLPDGVARSRRLRVPGRSREQTQDFAVSVALDYLRRRMAFAG